MGSWINDPQKAQLVGDKAGGAPADMVQMGQSTSFDSATTSMQPSLLACGSTLETLYEDEPRNTIQWETKIRVGTYHIIRLYLWKHAIA